MYLTETRNIIVHENGQLPLFLVTENVNLCCLSGSFPVDINTAKEAIKGLMNKASDLVGGTYNCARLDTQCKKLIKVRLFHK